MKTSLAIEPSALTAQRQEVIQETFRKERTRLLAFIRRRIPEKTDAEDVLQDVFYQLVESLSLPQSIEQVTAWLFRVARNKIIDRYRKKKPEALSAMYSDESNADESRNLTDLLFDPHDSPEDVYARSLIWEQLAAALAELPVEQREVFVGHELEGLSFKQLAQQTGVPVSTLLSRKRYAVLHLRERLQTVYHDLFHN